MNCLKALLVTVHSMERKIIDDAFEAPRWCIKVIQSDQFSFVDLVHYMDADYDWIFIDTHFEEDSVQYLNPDYLMLHLQKNTIHKGCGIIVFNSVVSESVDFSRQMFFSTFAQSIYSAYSDPESFAFSQSDILCSTEYRGVVYFQTPLLAKIMSLVLANLSKDPDRLELGLWEMFMNGIEHGNLGIDHDLKKNQVHSDNMDDLVQHRLKVRDYKDRFVNASYIINPKRATFDIKDEGDGFDWLKFWEIDNSRMLDRCGRGIALSRLMAFDHITYLGKGNNVICSSDFEKEDFE
ncbi:MAG: hypothetical protein C0432_02940 [Candidatus Puniceispirillum sp.]|nr:hypothetical protein [Candidatus Pelagibacter sp.]MBA4283232.1 hypothetical protein [Candidatus Puniceispirillum sp.]